MSPGVHVHEPGRLSRWGVVDVGLRCMHSCRFCYYAYLDGSGQPFAGMRKAAFLPTGHLLGLATGLAVEKFLGFDVTGGEPTLSPGIVELVAHGRRLGLAARIITLGQYLMRPMKSAPGHGRLVDALIEVGVADFLLSVHAVAEDRFKALTGESWAKLVAAMDHLDGLGFAYGTNTTVTAENYRDLPEIAREISGHNVYIANFIAMNAYYAWSRPDRPTRQVQGHYSELRPYLLEARDILESAGIAVNLRYAPLCTVRGLERNLVGIAGVRHDPHEWMNAIDHMSPGPASAMAKRLPLHDCEAHYPLLPSRDPVPAAAGSNGKILARRAGKVFPEACRACRAMAVCDGIDPNYLAARGSDELAPYQGFRGDLLDRDRLAYRAAFVIKTEPFADVRPVVRSLLRSNCGAQAPREISAAPSCEAY